MAEFAGKVSNASGLRISKTRSTDQEPFTLERPPFYLFTNGEHANASELKVASCPSKTLYALLYGQIFNCQSLSRKLETNGHSLPGKRDVDLLPTAYQKWGKAMSEHLEGSYSIVIFNAEEQIFYLIRDRVGQKPLYYALGQEFYFATSLNLLKKAGCTLAPAHSHLNTWLQLRYVPQPFTLFKEVYSLPAGHSLTVNRYSSPEIKRYWPSQASHPTNLLQDTRQTFREESHRIDELDLLANNAVADSLSSPSSILAVSSPGIDSSLLNYYLHQNKANFQTCSVSFEQEHTATAEDSSRKLNTELLLTPDCVQNLPRAITQTEMPIGEASILAYHALAQHAAAIGCTTVLGAEGPDEYFGGYNSHRTFLTAHRLGPLATPIAAILAQFAPASLLKAHCEIPQEFGKRDRTKLIVHLLKFAHYNLFQQASGLNTLFSEHQISNLVCPDLLSKQTLHPLATTQPTTEESLFSSALKLQFEHWLPDFLLRYRGNLMQAHGLHYHSPFLDQKLIEYAFTLNDRDRLKQGLNKYLWRKLAARHLPQENYRRPNRTLALPLQQPAWRNSLIRLAKDALAPENLKRHGWFNPQAIDNLFHAQDPLSLRQLASLTILQLWLDQFY